MIADIRDPQLYETWSEEDLKTHIKFLQGLVRAKDGSKPTFQDLLRPNSPNFLGSGMTLSDFLVTSQIRDFVVSFGQQDRPEKKRRLKYIVLLSVELAKIRETTRFSTAFAEGVIEAVIEGAWKLVSDLARDLTFEEECKESPESQEHYQQYQTIFSTFVTICREAFATRPQEQPTPATRH